MKKWPVGRKGILAEDEEKPGMIDFPGYYFQKETMKDLDAFLPRYKPALLETTLFELLYPFCPT
jgi:hypothetical protein